MVMDDQILQLKEWHTPATDYREEQVGNFRIHQSKYTRGYYLYYGMDGYIMLQVTKAIPITYLQERRGRRWCGWRGWRKVRERIEWLGWRIVTIGADRLANATATPCFAGERDGYGLTNPQNCATKGVGVGLER